MSATTTEAEAIRRGLAACGYWIENAANLNNARRTEAAVADLLDAVRGLRDAIVALDRRTTREED